MAGVLGPQGVASGLRAEYHWNHLASWRMGDGRGFSMHSSPQGLVGHLGILGGIDLPGNFEVKNGMIQRRVWLIFYIKKAVE